MKIRLLITVIALAASQAAFADWEIVTEVRAIELSPSNMILPASTIGMMTYRPCAGECDADYERARLTEATKYSVEGKAVKFSDFQRVFAAIKNGEQSYTLLSVDTKTRTVTGIDISG